MEYFEKYGTFYEVKGGVLYGAPAMLYECDGIGNTQHCCCVRVRPDPDEWGEVTAPQVVGNKAAHEFLNDINKEFGTDYKLEQFAGR